MSIKGAIKRLLGRDMTIEKQMTSLPLREDFARNGVTIGLYSYGCFSLERIGKNVTIGRYCSFADTARIFTRNHGMGYISTTPYLYNASLGFSESKDIAHEPCVIEDDVWIGHNAIILPSARRIGRGAVIAAGAVVTKPVDRYAIVGGNPARKLKDRFPPETIKTLEDLAWWNWSLDELKDKMTSDPDLIFDPNIYCQKRG